KYCNLTVADARITGNTPTQLYMYDPTGGGIQFSDGGTLKIYDSIITNNQASYGGGILAGGDSIEIHNCVVSGNSALTGGGIVAGVTHGAWSITGSTISGNTGSGGAGISTTSDLMVVGSTINGNRCPGYGLGGGISTGQDTTATPTFTLIDCTI